MFRKLVPLACVLAVSAPAESFGQDFLGALGRRVAESAAQNLINRAVAAATTPRAPTAPASPVSGPAVPSSSIEPSGAVASPSPQGPPVRRATVQSRTSPGPGLGSSKAQPEGPVYQLPAGVSLDQPLLGYNVEDPQDCDDKFAKEAKGSGGAVSLCLIFRNTTRRPVIVDLPPGLLVVSKDGNVQNGILAQRTSIEVPPGERYFAPLFLYCVNQDRRTSGIGDEYDLGPVVGYDAFQELYALLEGKVLTRQAVTPIQLAITHLSNNEGLTDEDRAALRAL